MTFQIALVLGILGCAVLFLVTEWMPMEVVALLVLGTLAVTGLVTPADALLGFSNPAVVTVWAVFILSGGLTRTGVGNIIGNRVVKLAGGNDTRLVMIVMVIAGLLSAFMNNVAVAALLLPVIMDICRSTRRNPSSLLLPLAYGSLLGGLLTQIGTPPNILVSAVLRENGLTPFGLFDFTPVGSFIFVFGILFMTFIGRRLLPDHDSIGKTSDTAESGMDSHYRMEDRIFRVKVPARSILDGKTLAETRMGTVLGMDVIAITRKNFSRLAPGPNERLRSGDTLVVKGNPQILGELKIWHTLISEAGAVSLEEVFNKEIVLVEATLTGESLLTGKTLSDVGFRNRFDAMVLAVRRREKIRRAKLQDEILEDGDRLLVQVAQGSMEDLCGIQGFGSCRPVGMDVLTKDYHLEGRLSSLMIPSESSLGGKPLKESRIAEVLGMQVLCIVRENGTVRMPDPAEILLSGDRLVMEGRMADREFLQGMQELVIEEGGERI